MKLFKFAFVLLGLILICTIIVIRMQDELPEKDRQAYNSAMQLAEMVYTSVWQGYNFKDYPTAIRYKDTEYVLYNNKLTKRKPILKAAANTARLVDGRANIFVLNINDMEVLKEFSEGIGTSEYILDKFSLQSKSMSDTEYIGILYHEGFHAFQFQRYGDVFVNRMLSLVKKYDIDEFLDIINRKEIYELYTPEALILHTVFDTKDSENIKLLVYKFLQEREIRHTKLKEILSKEDYNMLMDFEQYYEKLEGTATYINLKIAELLGDINIFTGYKDSIIKEFNGTKKFYNSGAGICYMLDKIGFPWKEDIFTNQLSFEQILQKSLEGEY